MLFHKLEELGPCEVRVLHGFAPDWVDGLQHVRLAVSELLGTGKDRVWDAYRDPDEVAVGPKKLAYTRVVHMWDVGWLCHSKTIFDIGA